MYCLVVKCLPYRHGLSQLYRQRTTQANAERIDIMITPFSVTIGCLIVCSTFTSTIICKFRINLTKRSSWLLSNVHGWR
ncbi:hypothetical protein PAXRUDRAFT_587934 [Paxillus rubicundulus Ve08.2h10]|uniref:Uncharacterized protein n=1 Tax=Paxillus rubicundulus Ve08.2h10 TaxID=930991 RepID=A0A0D0DKR2_9AGAM|nr:hypothetical protein PAXRUDRAFT_587934 [Paxillus rubicundulus Ve08.2h10]